MSDEERGGGYRQDRVASGSKATASADCTIAANSLAAKTDIDSPLLSWVGKFPSDTPVANCGTLLQQAGLRKLLMALLPAPEVKRLGEFDTKAPVRRVVVNKCRPPACAADTATIVIDLRWGRACVGFFTRGAAGVATRWYGNRHDWSALPPAIVTDVLKRHGGIAPRRAITPRS